MTKLLLNPAFLHLTFPHQTITTSSTTRLRFSSTMLNHKMVHPNKTNSIPHDLPLTSLAYYTLPKQSEAWILLSISYPCHTSQCLTLPLLHYTSPSLSRRYCTILLHYHFFISTQLDKTYPDYTLTALSGSTHYLYFFAPNQYDVCLHCTSLLYSAPIQCPSSQFSTFASLSHYFTIPLLSYVAVCPSVP